MGFQPKQRPSYSPQPSNAQSQYLAQLQARMPVDPYAIYNGPPVQMSEFAAQQAPAGPVMRGPTGTAEQMLDSNLGFERGVLALLQQAGRPFDDTMPQEFMDAARRGAGDSAEPSASPFLKAFEKRRALKAATKNKMAGR